MNPIKNILNFLHIEAYAIFLILRGYLIRMNGKNDMPEKSTVLYKNTGRHGELTFNSADQALVDKGKRLAEQLSINVCCLAKDVEPTLTDNINFINELLVNFKSFRFIIVENGSSDDTANILKGFSKQYKDRFIILDGHHSVKKNSSSEISLYRKNRMNSMQILRQKYIDYIKEDSLDKYSYSIIFDIDLTIDMDIKGLYHSIGYLEGNPGVDAITPNLIDTRYTLRDTFSHMEKKPHIFDAITKDQFQLRKYQLKMQYITHPLTQPRKILCAFGGLTIYKTESIKDCSYIGRQDICEHYNLSKDINIHINPYLFIRANV